MIDTSPFAIEASIKAEAATSSPAKKTMGKDDFMKLLVAQMQAQDPLDPMGNSEFSAQLAQFSALEQMQNVNTNMQNLIQVQESINNNMAINLIGKSITAPGNDLTISNGVSGSGTVTISYELGKNTDSAIIDIFDSGSNLVASIVKGAETAGANNYTWNGKDLNGKILPDGNYTFKISAVDASGSPVVTRTLQNSSVTGVFFEDGISYAIAGNNKIDVKDISSVNSTL